MLEKEQIQNFYNIIDDEDSINIYFEYIKKLNINDQKNIYNELHSFLSEKKQEILDQKYIRLDTEKEIILKKINYYLHHIKIELEKFQPKYKRITTKKEDKKKIEKMEPVKNNISKINAKEKKYSKQVNDENTIEYDELLNYMELELDIECNNIKNIIETYKKFVRKNNNIVIHWQYTLKITNLIIQKMSSINSINRKNYISSILDTLKYQKASISKEETEQKENIKTLQTIWKNIYINTEEKATGITSDYKNQIKNIQNCYNFNKEEANIIWLKEIENQICNCSIEELEKIIMILVSIKEEFKDNNVQEELQKIINKNISVFENYFNIYMMNMNIPKEKKNILESLKILIKSSYQEKNENQSYRLFHAIIFEEKDLSSLKKVLSLDPKFINVKNYDGRYFLENLLDLYINQIMNNKYDFLKNTFEIYLKYAGIYMNQELKNNLVNQIKDTIEDYKEENNIEILLTKLLDEINNINLLDNLKIKDEEVYIHKKNNLKYRQFKNLLYKYIITIDQNDTKFYENAISCERLKDGNYEVGIYISDVVDCLNQDLIIESNDLKHREFKMNVNRYKKYILKERKVKLAIAFIFVLDEELEVVNFKIERARIKVKKNYTIEEATKILDDGDSDSKIFYILQRMNNVARMMYRKRNPKGHLKRYMDFIPEIQREFTYFVNRQIATICTNNNLPLIYKNQLPRNSSNLYELFDEIYSMTDKIEKIMEIAEADKISNYSTINRGNDLFDGSCYTQITSPTRDLPSLLNQILIINNFIDNEYINKEQKQNLEKTLLLVNHYNNPKK